MLEVKTKSGMTTEGHAYELMLTYAEGQDPIEVHGTYGSDDGGGSFVIKKTDDGMFEIIDGLGETEKETHAWKLIPGVIYDAM